MSHQYVFDEKSLDAALIRWSEAQPLPLTALDYTGVIREFLRSPQAERLRVPMLNIDSHGKYKVTT